VVRVRTVRPRGSTPGRNKNFYLRKSSCLFSGHRGQSGRGVNLTSNFHLAPRIRKKGAVTPRHAHTFVTWTELLYNFFFIFLLIPIFVNLLSPVTFLNSTQFTRYDLYRFARLTDVSVHNQLTVRPNNCSTTNSVPCSDTKNLSACQITQFASTARHAEPFHFSGGQRPTETLCH
jgi:hypothetical protein